MTLLDRLRQAIKQNNLQRLVTNLSDAEWSTLQGRLRNGQVASWALLYLEILRSAPPLDEPLARNERKV